MNNMLRKIKKAVSLGLAVLLFVFLLAPAQSVRAIELYQNTAYIALTNVVALVGTNTTTNFTTQTDVPKGSGLGLQWRFNMTATAVSNVWIKGFPSRDNGTNYDTIPEYVLGATASGTTDVVVGTNIPTASMIGVDKIRWRFDNANSENLTNKQFIIKKNLQ